VVVRCVDVDGIVTHTFFYIFFTLHILIYKIKCNTEQFNGDRLVSYNASVTCSL